MLFRRSRGEGPSWGGVLNESSSSGKLGSQPCSEHFSWIFSGRSASLLNGKSLLENVRRRARLDNSHAANRLAIRTACASPAASVSSPTERVFRHIMLRTTVGYALDLENRSESIRPGKSHYGGFSGRAKRTPNVTPSEVFSSRLSRDRAFIVRGFARRLF